MVPGQTDCKTQKLGMEQMNLKYKGHTTRVIGAITKGMDDGIQESTNCSGLEDRSQFEFIYGRNAPIGL
jgi:hypothetical protein